MLSSPRSPSSTIRIFSSAENRRRVCRRISRTTFSVDPAFAMASPSDGGRPGGRHRVAGPGSRPLARHAASAARSLAWHHAHRKVGWRASSMTRADPHRRRPVRLARRTRRGRAWPAGRSRPAGMGSWSGPPTRRTVPAGTASRERGSRSASRSSTGRAGGWRSRRRGRARRSRFLPGRTVGRAHRPTSRSVQVHSAATRGSPHIAVPSPSQIPLPCRAHQSECGRTPPARGRHTTRRNRVP